MINQKPGCKNRLESHPKWRSQVQVWQIGVWRPVLASAQLPEFKYLSPEAVGRAGRANMSMMGTQS